jgi:hypothetical protein
MTIMNMKRSLLLITIIFGVTTPGLRGQSFLTPDDRIVNGFARKLSGTDFEYHSCIPGLRESILVRATGGKDMMEWETAAAPEYPEKKYAAFVWIAALGSGPGTARMDLTVNGEPSLSFFTDGRRSWDIEGSGGAMLSFRAVMTDQHGDHHGYMILRMPAGSITPRKPLKLRVTGSASNLSSWYMTFRKPVETGVTLNAFPAMLKNQGNPLQLVEAGIFYFGDGAEAKIFADGKLIEKTTLNFGYNSVNLGLPAVRKPKMLSLKIVAGDFSAASSVTLEPVRKWHISFIQHAHTDIGYTRPQNEILAEHLRYIDYALDYCDATDSYPENARFRWTCEASWPVDEYLRCRPQEQKERLIRRIREGRIEVTGMYFNFDELPDEQILAASLQAVGRIKEQGIPVTVAMQNDVNGIGWCLNDYYDGLGVKYLNMGTHGHRALICFNRPTLFWWESPSGKRMLTFRAEHYMTGNTVMEVQTGDINKFKNNLLNYLISLEAKGYPYDRMAIQHSGYLTDNSPPSTSMSKMILQWNDIFEWPKLTTSTAESFFSQMEAGHGSEFPVIRGAWPDWWTDGFGASAREVAATRNAAVQLTANTGGLSMAAVAGMSLPEETAEKSALANEALLFYTEHTTGYSESVREPYSQPTMEQRALKESYAWEAVRRTASLGEAAMGLLQSMFEREKEPSLVVFNTLSWRRSALATVYIDHQIVPRGMRAGIYDREGNRMASQPLSSRSDGTYWAIWCSDIPAFGYKKLLIRPEREETMPSLPQHEETVPSPPQSEKTLSPPFHSDEPMPPSPHRNNTLENSCYRIVTDNSSGIIKSIYDKELSGELVDSQAQYDMGEFILEQLGNRSQMENRMLNDYRRLSLDTIWFDSMSGGEVWNSIRFYAESETAIGPRGYSFEIRLFNTCKRIDLSCSITKKSITDPESFYIAFPFAVENGIHFTEVAGGVIRTGTDQIPGSSNDWYTVQNFTAVRNDQMQVVMGSGEMPLMQFGAINTGRYQAGAVPQTTHIYSWPMNNYWVTNFNADQRGGHSWNYYLTSSDDNSDSFATRFGWGARVPLLTRIIPGAGPGDERWEGAFIDGWPSGVILVNARPDTDGESVIIQLRETGGEETVLSLSNGITGQPLTVREVDVTGNSVIAPYAKIGPLESKFFEIVLP